MAALAFHFRSLDDVLPPGGEGENLIVVGKLPLTMISVINSPSTLLLFSKVSGFFAYHMPVFLDPVLSLPNPRNFPEILVSVSQDFSVSGVVSLSPDF